ncbi:hypothetical protein Ddye_009151 [Dipteronia dyeriana]|uniref:RNase H type-1 domain-containing protein n=1 Tax=Dipteronia dyeriana TaxID=168575 RepID=A0AAD9XB25_9ROSI|nr:hypothetical protein Ddye_009151 [Dipteronia dyeriana]
MIGLSIFLRGIGKLIRQSYPTYQAKRWIAPPVGIFKINTDAALNHNENVSGICVVIRVYKGYVMASLCQKLKVGFLPQISDVMAIPRVLRLALETGLVLAILESDALEVVTMIKSMSVPSLEIGEVRSFMTF